jgi:hypothetical protein
MSDVDPTRIIIRNMAGLVLRGVTLMRRAVSDQVAPAFLFAAVRRANIDHIPYGAREALSLLPDAGGDSDGLRRGISVNALSRAFDMPYETVRTCVNRFIDRDMMERRSDGVVVPGRVLARSPFRETDEEIAAALIDAVNALARLGIDLESIAGPTRQVAGGAPGGLIARIAMDAALGATELIAPAFGGFTNGLVYCGVLVTSSRRLFASPEEAWRYAAQDAPPPDEAREPVSLRALSAALELPFETTRRHAHDLIARRLLTAVPGQGVTPHAEAVGPNGIGRIMPALAGQAASMLRALAQIGFDVSSWSETRKRA